MSGLPTLYVKAIVAGSELLLLAFDKCTTLLTESNLALNDIEPKTVSQPSLRFDENEKEKCIFKHG